MSYLQLTLFMLLLCRLGFWAAIALPHAESTQCSYPHEPPVNNVYFPITSSSYYASCNDWALSTKNNDLVDSTRLFSQNRV
ncbi:hypothetical protein EB796_003421 [Bugula neritina]|uniref:Secreted protein n=1 Tax=Bugula neritina TaxID=10212 RepID=A0A7J7KHW2_BUGNE|nr:hypothetical protein EB796_003421 [Bugula neritina]